MYIIPLLLLFLIRNCLSSVRVDLLKPDEIAIVQFDSRPLKDYWLAAAKWNHAFCRSHGHQFLYYSTDEECHYKQEPLASAWCKVKAMINAMEDFPNVKLFIYMDSDAVIDHAYATLPLTKQMGTMQDRLKWYFSAILRVQFSLFFQEYRAEAYHFQPRWAMLVV